MNPDLTFLVVDGLSTMRRIVAGLLRQCGASRILEAEDGVQALRLLESNPDAFNQLGGIARDLLESLRELGFDRSLGEVAAEIPPTHAIDLLT